MGARVMKNDAMRCDKRVGTTKRCNAMRRDIQTGDAKGCSGIRSAVFFLPGLAFLFERVHFIRRCGRFLRFLRRTWLSTR